MENVNSVIPGIITFNSFLVVQTFKVFITIIATINEISCLRVLFRQRLHRDRLGNLLVIAAESEQHQSYCK